MLEQRITPSRFNVDPADVAAALTDLFSYGFLFLNTNAQDAKKGHLAHTTAKDFGTLDALAHYASHSVQAAFKRQEFKKAVHAHDCQTVLKMFWLSTLLSLEKAADRNVQDVVSANSEEREFCKEIAGLKETIQTLSQKVEKMEKAGKKRAAWRENSGGQMVSSQIHWKAHWYALPKIRQPSK